MKVEKAGKKRIQCVFVQADNMGAVSACVDGQDVLWEGGNESISLLAPGRTLLRMISLVPLDLEAGEHVLSLRFEGADDDIQAPEVGLDFIGLQSIEN